MRAQLTQVSEYKCNGCKKSFSLKKLFPLIFEGTYYGTYCRACYLRRSLYMTQEEFDWTYYYAEITKAKAERVKWGALGFIFGVWITAAASLAIVKYLALIP